MNKQLRKQVRAQLVKDLRDITAKHTPIDDILNKLALQFGCKRSDILDAISEDDISKDDNGNYKVLFDPDS